MSVQTDASGDYIMQLEEKVPGQYGNKTITFWVAGVNTAKTEPFAPFDSKKIDLTATKSGT